jgi:hypothetical protein
VEMRGLAVYEPPYTGGHHPGPEFGEHHDHLVASGRRDQATTHASQRIVEGQQHVPADPVVAAILGRLFG